jgi:hypothetical protein
VEGRPLSMPAAGGGLVFLAEADAVRALRVDTGAVAWRVELAQPLAGPLAWDNGWLVAAGESGTVAALRADDGSEVWRQSVGSRVHATVAMAGLHVYVPTEDGHLVALDVRTGARVWDRRLGGPANDVLGLEDRVYVGSDDNYLYCLQPATGEVDWRWRTGGDVVGMPVADEHRVYFVSKDNVLRALDRHSGAQRWQRPLTVRPTRGPVRAGDLLLVSGIAPRIATFATKDGTPSTDISAPGELAGEPYPTLTLGLPQVVLVARDVAAGTRVLAYRRNIEPALNAALNTLPGAIVIAKPGTPGDPTLGGATPTVTASSTPVAATNAPASAPAPTPAPAATAPAPPPAPESAVPVGVPAPAGRQRR